MTEELNQDILFFQTCANIAKLRREEYRAIREFLVISSRNRSKEMKKIVEDIALLNDQKFKELRSWMFLRPSLLEWIELMKS